MSSCKQHISKALHEWNLHTFQQVLAVHTDADLRQSEISELQVALAP